MRYTDPRSGITVSGDHPFALEFVKSLKQSESDSHAWCRKLAEDGVMAAHPDDGWVNREENYVDFAYPDFNLWPDAGDTIALGWHDKFRLVKVVRVEKRSFASYPLYTRYYFEKST